MSLGDRIVELRKLNNLSQGELATAMGLSRQAVSKWEKGLSCPDAQNLIRLTEILDTDMEYLTTGRRTYGMRPPVVVKTVETVEKVVEKPVYVEKIVDRVVEKPVVEFVEKPVVKRVTRVKYIRNPIEFLIVGGCCFIAGLIIGLLF